MAEPPPPPFPNDYVISSHSLVCSLQWSSRCKVFLTVRKLKLCCVAKSQEKHFNATKKTIFMASNRFCRSSHKFPFMCSAPKKKNSCCTKCHNVLWSLLCINRINYTTQTRDHIRALLACSILIPQKKNFAGKRKREHNERYFNFFVVLFARLTFLTINERNLIKRWWNWILLLFSQYGPQQRLKK